MSKIPSPFLSCQAIQHAQTNQQQIFAMRSESSFVQDWCIFEDSEPSWSDSTTSFGFDFVVAATPVASPRRRVRRASLASSLSHALDLSESSAGGASVKSEQGKSKTSSRAPRRLSLRPGSSAAKPSSSHAPPRTPAKKNTRRRSSILHSTDKLCNTMTSCSLMDLMKVNHTIHLDTASSSSGSATPIPTEHNSNNIPRRRQGEENNAHGSPRRSSPRRTRRLVSMPQVGSAKQALSTRENACTRRMARRMSQA